MARKFKPLPSLSRLVELGFTYDPETGRLYCQGVERTPNGNSQISIDGSLYTAHRICWLLHTGIEPDRIVDHWNGLDNDNRIENLRLATDPQNCINKRSRLPGRYPGVKYLASHRVWIAAITFNGTYHELGRFPDEQSAVAARKAGEKRIAGAFAFSNRTKG